jgi:uncharacterized membrane protein YciS (DUF1049 family)
MVQIATALLFMLWYDSTFPREAQHWAVEFMIGLALGWIMSRLLYLLRRGQQWVHARIKH